MPSLVDKVATLWPEIVLLTASVLCLIFGLSGSKAVRRLTVLVAWLALVLAGWLVPQMGEVGLVPFMKLAVVGIGLLLLLVTAGVPDGLRQTQEAQRDHPIGGKRFDPGNVLRGEFYAFFLLSLTGVMLTAGASDLVWLFLALELTSLPTYVMVATSRDDIEAQESAVKYFFLGALSAAVFLYGFALIYGATGYTDFELIRQYLAAQIASGEGLSPLMLAGVIFSVVGIGFKIAAVPMHFYTADVYEGAATPVTTFLAFVPKTAGFLAMILILGLIGWPLPEPLVWLLWAMAAVTMTVGNVLGLLQDNVKRVLAYSSIAHSGYMIVGLLAGSSIAGGDAGPLTSGLAAIVFYLIAYGVGTTACFAVLGLVRKSDGSEAQTYDDIAGLAKTQPTLAAVMLVGVLSLLGFPFTVGLIGKLYLIGPTYQAGFTILVIILVLNSAISAGYYLRIASVCFFAEPSKDIVPVGAYARRLAALVAVVVVIFLGIAGDRLVSSANDAVRESNSRLDPVASLPAPTSGLD